ncbi:MAG: (2Fe-2S)-binding protein [Planctomycetes bacterium]|nr:(2Fe-2S)-binding protein [Planctomycetota bacterium]
MSRSDQPQDASGVSRRGFLKGVGAGALAAGAVAPAAAALGAKAGPQAAAAGTVFGPAPVAVALNVNGKVRQLRLEPRVTLLDALRNHLDLTGAKKVCDRATCGACTVLLDGKAVYACTVLAVEANGRAIETVEGLAETHGGAAPIQKCFVANDAQQCGFCTPGFVMACESFKRANPGATREQALDGLGGNLCRCGTYHGVAQAVVDALAGKGGN